MYFWSELGICWHRQGPLPSELGWLTNLQDLQLWGNQFTGKRVGIHSPLDTYPCEFGLHAWYDPAGLIPPEMSTCARLHILNLRDNKLTGGLQIMPCSTSPSKLIWHNIYPAWLPSFSKSAPFIMTFALTRKLQSFATSSTWPSCPPLLYILQFNFTALASQGHLPM